MDIPRYKIPNQFHASQNKRNNQANNDVNSTQIYSSHHIWPC
jgi:hypothetical protein